MNSTIVLIGDITLDTLHLILSGLVLIMGAIAVWLLPFRKNLTLAREAALAAEARFTSLDIAHDVLDREHVGLKARHEEMLISVERERTDLSGRLEKAEDVRRTLQLRLEDTEKALESLKVREEERRNASESEKKQLLELRGEVETKFSEIAQTALTKSQTLFLETANETFGRQKEAAEGNLKELFSPLKEAIGKFETRVEGLEKSRTEDKSAIFEQVKNISLQLNENRTVTNKLVNALSTPKGGGRWGEETLRNVMEMAGLSEHADFTEQVQGNGDALRPDVVIRMPGGRDIVVDSKVSVEDFLLAAEETDDGKRTAFLTAHARKLRDHVKRLASKEYWKAFESRVDFVAMYIPGENFYAAAVQIDRELFDFAARNRVLIVTPSTLIALAKAVSYGWRQEEASKNAREAAELGKELYKRLATMTEHVENMGKTLKATVKNYDKMTSSLESRVLTQARRFEDLQIAESGGKAIPALEQLGGYSFTENEDADPADVEDVDGQSGPFIRGTEKDELNG